jgi:hypothetical protein
MHESGFGRMIGALISPEKTFRSIAERPTWVVPLLLLILISVFVGYEVGKRVDFEQQIRQQMAEQGQTISEADLQKSLEFMEKFGKVLFLAPAIFSPAIYLVIAVIFLVAFRLAGSEITFGQSFSVFLHAMVPWLVHGLLSLPLILRQETLDPEAMQRGGVLMSNLAALAPEGSGKVFLALLASLDLFTIWALVLLIIGYRVVARVSTATAAAFVLTLWLLYLAGKLGITAVFA